MLRRIIPASALSPAQVHHADPGPEQATTAGNHDTIRRLQRRDEAHQRFELALCAAFAAVALSSFIPVPLEISSKLRRRLEDRCSSLALFEQRVSELQGRH